MNQQHCLKQLRLLNLTGMAQSLEQQWSQPQTYDDLDFTERMSLLVDQEVTTRTNKRLQRLILNTAVSPAKSKVSAHIYIGNARIIMWSITPC